MPKKKKTLKQKLRSDLRQQQQLASEVITSSEEKQIIATVPVVSPVSISSHSTAISTTAYTYLSHDLRRTFFLTVLIVGLELALYYILH